MACFFWSTVLYIIYVYWSSVARRVIRPVAPAPIQDGKFQFISEFDVHRTKAFSLRRRCPEGVDEVEMFRICPNLHENVTFFCTPHQSAAPTASPQGEAFVGAHLNDKSEFSGL